MDISKYTITELQALAYRLVVQRDQISSDLLKVEQRIEELARQVPADQGTLNLPDPDLPTEDQSVEKPD